MTTSDSVIAVFANHDTAEAAVRQLNATEFAMKQLSVVGRGFHTEAAVGGIYSLGDQIKFWRSRGAFWGGLWGLFLGEIFIAVPVIGRVIVLGHLAETLGSATERAVVFGGPSTFGTALVASGVPIGSVAGYETALAADGFLVMARGTTDEIARAKAILQANDPSSLEVHCCTPSEESAAGLVRAVG